ncbi:hypothetical protein Hanom_Chr01g00087881 [Helianthus anomalus]
MKKRVVGPRVVPWRGCDGRRKWLEGEGVGWQRRWVCLVCLVWGNGMDEVMEWTTE